MERSNIITDIFMQKEQPTIVAPTVEAQPQIVDLHSTTEENKVFNNRGDGSIDVIKI
jgi:hypothetical protein